MPTITRWFIKVSLLYLVVALATALSLALPADIRPDFITTLTPVYFHLFMVGWVTQMIIGVVYWMFPIISRQELRGDVRPWWAVFILLNAGLLLRVVGEPLAATRPGTLPGTLLLLSALLQWLAGLVFVIIAWPRVKGKPGRS